ncbi:hypothetical protein B7494_g6276 [Chlorociboria aeruginascens]|nr:hypothetical protein B7494_g6276 [Chlorociboria aeruginascens]
MQAQEFTLFPELPFELRTKIWTHALPAPQAVHLAVSRKGNLSPIRAIALVPDSPNQGSLSLACHASRDVFLKYFSPIKIKDFKHSYPNPTYYFDLRHDTLIVESPASLASYMSKVTNISLVQRIACHRNSLGYSILALDFKMALSNLRILSILVSGEYSWPLPTSVVESRTITLEFDSEFENLEFYKDNENNRFAGHFADVKRRETIRKAIKSGVMYNVLCRVGILGFVDSAGYWDEKKVRWVEGERLWVDIFGAWVNLENGVPVTRLRRQGMLVAEDE